MEAEWGFLAQLHQLPRCMEDEKSLEKVKKLQQQLQFTEQLHLTIK